MLWDTAGQEEYDAITRTYYKGAGACLIAFSTVDRNSFNAVESWFKKVRDECGPIPIVLVQTKADLITQAVLSKEEAEGLARRLNLRLFRVCAKENLNVSEVFETVGVEFIQRGGYKALGTQAVQSINKQSPTSTGTEKAAGGEEKQENSSAFKLAEPDIKPAVQRTGGKKSRIPMFTNCSVL
jgi:Ras-related protein Rab-23